MAEAIRQLTEEGGYTKESVKHIIEDALISAYNDFSPDHFSKEYDVKGTLQFDGEYLNDKRWNGNGMEFDINGNLVFDGKYLNGNRWEGAIIEYDLDDGEIIVAYFTQLNIAYLEHYYADYAVID